MKLVFDKFQSIRRPHLNVETDMEIKFARKNWKILQKMEKNFTDQVREFMVINNGDGVLVVTEPDGKTFWFGKMRIGCEEWREATKPIQLGVSNLVKMAQGSNHIVLLDGRGKIHTLGINNQGQLGLETVDDTIHFTPQLIYSPQRFVDVRCGIGHSLALNDDGMVFGWGWNTRRQIGGSSDDFDISSLERVLHLDTHQVVAIECGGLHSLALTDQGQVYGWGCNEHGQLAQTNRSKQPTPKRMETASAVTQIAAGYGHTLLLTKEELVFACGLNDFGQLGQPTSIRDSSSLCQVSGLPRIVQIASHFDTDLSIALSTDRRCYVWGKWSNSKRPTPLRLSSIYSTVESPFSCTKSDCRKTPSIRLRVSQNSTIQKPNVITILYYFFRNIF